MSNLEGLYMTVPTVLSSYQYNKWFNTQYSWTFWNL